MDTAGDPKPKEVVIAKEDAVFWMDGQGNWHNQHGKFENRRIAAYFHTSIARDAGGYHVAQMRDGMHEKVYFRHEDTALFVFGIEWGAADDQEPSVTLTLNTGRRLLLDPQQLYIEGESLYLLADQERIKFNQAAMLKMSRIMDFEEERYFLRMGAKRFEIPTHTQTKER